MYPILSHHKAIYGNAEKITLQILLYFVPKYMGQFSKYDEDTVSRIRTYFGTLTHKGKRHYASVEVKKLISMDGKKKEHLGNLYRAGKLYTMDSIEVYDHDYAHLAKGKIIPFGIYDLQRNEGYISIGSSHETADFIADNLLWWWEEFGIHQYPDAKDILILCDAGGANSYRHHAFKNKCFF
ncbi:MAG: hypothetical protein R3E32_24740 [Chitinophagales bacterium]